MLHVTSYLALWGEPMEQQSNKALPLLFPNKFPTYHKIYQCCVKLLYSIGFLKSWTKTWMYLNSCLNFCFTSSTHEVGPLSHTPWRKMLQHTYEKSWPNQTSIHLYMSRWHVDQMAGPTARRQGHWLARVYLSHHASCEEALKKVWPWGGKSGEGWSYELWLVIFGRKIEKCMCNANSVFVSYHLRAKQ